MEILPDLGIGVLGSVIGAALVSIWRVFRQRSLRKDIEFLEMEKQHLEAMKRSSVEMNREAFSALFALMMFAGVAQALPLLLDLSGVGSLPKLGNSLSLVVWAMFIGWALRYTQRYGDLKHFKAALERIDKRIDQKKSKLK